MQVPRTGSCAMATKAVNIGIAVILQMGFPLHDIWITQFATPQYCFFGESESASLLNSLQRPLSEEHRVSFAAWQSVIFGPWACLSTAILHPLFDARSIPFLHRRCDSHHFWIPMLSRRPCCRFFDACSIRLLTMGHFSTGHPWFWAGLHLQLIPVIMQIMTSSSRRTPLSFPTLKFAHAIPRHNRIISTPAAGPRP
jgi:hypothetical protein